MNRRQRREAAKRGKNVSNEELENKVSLFGKLPDECLTCQKPYDKKDKEMVSTWSVVVREEEHSVRLYCPECWTLAQNIIEEWKGKLNEKD